MVFTYWVFYLTMLFLIAYIGVIAIEKSKKFWNKTKMIDGIEERYEQLRSSRREMLQHYYWAQSCGEKQKEKAMEEQIFKTDDELDELRNQFKSLQASKSKL